MTSKDVAQPAASRGALTAFRERRDRNELIVDGLLPGLDELFEGMPFFGNNIDRDIQAWCDSAASLPLWRREEGKIVQMAVPRPLKAAISVLRDTCQPMAIEAVRLQRIIVRNSARCLVCLDEIESTHRHDFVRCSCGRIAVDGGTAYVRRLMAKDARWEDTSIYQGDDE